MKLQNKYFQYSDKWVRRALGILFSRVCCTNSPATNFPDSDTNWDKFDLDGYDWVLTFNKDEDYETFTIEYRFPEITNEERPLTDERIFDLLKEGQRKAKDSEGNSLFGGQLIRVN